MINCTENYYSYSIYQH